MCRYAFQTLQKRPYRVTLVMTEKNQASTKPSNTFSDYLLTQ